MRRAATAGAEGADGEEEELEELSKKLYDEPEKKFSSFRIEIRSGSRNVKNDIDDEQSNKNQSTAKSNESYVSSGLKEMKTSTKDNEEGPRKQTKPPPDEVYVSERSQLTQKIKEMNNLLFRVRLDHPFRCKMERFHWLKMTERHFQCQ